MARPTVGQCYPLSDADMWRSRSAVPGDLGRLRAFARKARSGAAVKVVSLGGSVTNGGGCESYALAQVRGNMCVVGSG